MTGNGCFIAFRRCCILKNKDLKSFDIASYDVEIEYNSKIAPIVKKISKLNSSHDKRSMKSHKDFLSKEKKSREDLNILSEKTELKLQRIEKAVENKRIKLRTKDQRIKKEFEVYKTEEKAKSVIRVEEINQIVKELNSSEIVDTNKVQTRYRENVKSYVEKLDIYNNNFENNHKIHIKQIKEYSDLLNKKLADIDKLKTSLDKDISEKLQSYLETKGIIKDNINVSLAETEKHLNADTTNIKKVSNLKVKEIKKEIDILQDKHKKRFKEYILHIEEQIETIKNDYEARKELVMKDLQINVDKLDLAKEDEIENQSKNTKKTIRMKIELFNLRASTTLKYEERILNEKIVLLEDEVTLLNRTLSNELENLEKLEIFLLNDQNEIKDTGDYFKDLNILTKQELNNFELSNNEYLIKNERLKTEFISKYTDLFDKFKQSLLSLNKSSIEQLTVINQEIDEINKFLDTSEPLRDIEESNLREKIEVTEIKERYNIKHAKQKHELKILSKELDNNILFEEMNVKNELLDNNKNITDVKNKEILDKANEIAKLKHSKANELYKLRLNSTKLEQNILKSSFTTELEVYDLEKSITRFEVQKDDVLISKEITNNMINIEKEADYKIEVINNHLEEDLLKFTEQVTLLNNKQEAFSSNIDLQISKEKINSEKQVNKIIDEIALKYSRIDEAFEREIKEPKINVIKSEAIINERLSKLEVDDDIFSDFIRETTEALLDKNLSIYQIMELTVKNPFIYNNSSKYIQKTFVALIEANKFMNELQKRPIVNKISSSTDQSENKKFNKQLSKLDGELNKKLSLINSSIKEKELLIKNQIKSDLIKLSKQKTDNIDTLRGMILDILESCFLSLKDIKKDIVKETSVLYFPLLKLDKEIIKNGELNALKAKNLLEIEKNEKIAPVERQSVDLIEQLNLSKQSNYDELEAEKKEFTDQVDGLKQKALSEIQEIDEERTKLIESKQEQLRIIEESEEAKITKQMELLDAKKLKMTTGYEDALLKLQGKDEEAKKIYDYENKIYEIALETATSRFNDANLKTENANQMNINENNQNIEKIKQDTKKYFMELNKDLLNLTNQFEKNIFTTRPRLEESIGDAQKAIEKEVAIKEKRLSDLLETHSEITQSLENDLFNSFQDGYENLMLNLNNYLEQYKEIGDNYIASNNASNVVISDNNIALSNSLFELGSKKYKITLEKITEINTKII